MSKTIRVRNLRRGSLFSLCGERHRLLYVNDCRAYVEKAIRETVTVRRLNKETGIPEEQEFDAKAHAFSISPATIVQVERKSDRPALGGLLSHNG